MSAAARVLRDHAAFVSLLVMFAAVSLLFTHSSGLASVGDDSVSYLVLARGYAGSADAAVREWAGSAAHFPPLFPLLLAAAGASEDLARAHAVVSACAALALIAVYAFAFGVSRSRLAALGVSVLFVLTPSAWIDQLGILSEPLYLFVSFAALELQRRLAQRPEAGVPARLAFGVVLAAVVLTRSAGVALVLAYVIHETIALARRRQTPAQAALPLIPVILFAAAWIALRPATLGENYASVLRTATTYLSQQPAAFVWTSAKRLADGWIALFTGQSAVEPAVRAFFLAAAAAAIAGAVLAIRRHRSDGWYVLAYIAMLGLWLFPEETTRRLLYPIAPLALLHGGEALHAVLARMRPAAARLVRGGAALAIAMMTLPAALLVAAKAMDRTVPPGFGQPLASISNDYTIIPVGPAREMAGRHLAILAGLARLERSTPSDARVLWMRPDYVAVLGHRTGVPWYYAEGMDGVVRQLVATGARYLVLSTLFKADLRGEQTGPVVTAQSVAPFSSAVYVVNNPATGGDDFALMEVDAGALAAYARSRGIR